MAKSREEMQDIALYHMDKMNRRTKGERDNRPPTLEEQLAEEERRKHLTPEQKMKEMTYQEWAFELREWMGKRETHRRYTTFSSKFSSWLFTARRNELVAYHEKGTVFTDLANWLQDMQMVHMNLT